VGEWEYDNSPEGLEDTAKGSGAEVEVSGGAAI